ncbi:MAG: hypothetical protein Q9211_006510 [Gyalolechia sp. 1 TL-2023]
MGVLPSDWRFRFMGSSESVGSIKTSRAIKHQVDAGKLDLTYIPSNMTTGGQEQISRFLTTLWLYERVLQPAEWLLVFQTDTPPKPQTETHERASSGILCANSEGNVDDWLEYDWVGAPWTPWSRYGGNGGLSLRRVSSIIQVLREQIRIPNSDPEDVWLTSRLGHRPGAKLANGSLSLTFSGENIYYDKPMGYHTGGSGRNLGGGIWGTPELRQHIYDYCPEVKMTLEMDPAQYIAISYIIRTSRFTMKPSIVKRLLVAVSMFSGIAKQASGTPVNDVNLSPRYDYEPGDELKRTMCFCTSDNTIAQTDNDPESFFNTTEGHRMGYVYEFEYYNHRSASFPLPFRPPHLLSPCI